MTTINDSYAEDAKAIEMIQQLAINATACLGYELKKGLLYYKSKLYIGNKGDLRDKLLQQYHDFALGGHSEIQPTYASLKRHFFLLGLLSSVTSWIQHCDVVLDARAAIQPLQDYYSHYLSQSKPGSIFQRTLLSNFQNLVVRM